MTPWWMTGVRKAASPMDRWSGGGRLQHLLWGGCRPGSVAVVMATLLVILQVAPVTPLSAENIGREFVFAFPPNFYQGSEASVGVVLTATTTNPTTVDVNVPHKGYATRVNILPSDIPLHLDMPPDVAMAGIFGVSNATVWLRASHDISVVAYNAKEYTMDLFTVMPSRYMGAEYFVSTYTQPSGGIILISALAEVTSVEVQLTAAVTFVGRRFQRGEVIRYTLDRFQTMQLEPTDDNIAGTRIIANRTIVATVGCMCAYVPPQYQRCDHLAEQLIPFNRWGQSYILSPLAFRLSGYQFQIIGGRDGTIVMVDNIRVTLAAGQSYTGDIGGQRMASIQSNKPIMIMQYSKGTTTDSQPGDPAMAIATPIEAYGSRVNFPVYDFTAIGIDHVYLSVTMECNTTTNIQLDGHPNNQIIWRQAYNVTTQNDRHYCTRWMVVAGGNHVLTVGGRETAAEETVFTSLVYGVGSRIAYLYNAGFNLEKVTCTRPSSNPGSPGAEVPCESLRPQTCSADETNSSHGMIVWRAAGAKMEVLSDVLCPFYTMRSGLPVAKRVCLYHIRTGARWSAITFIDCGRSNVQISAGELSQIEVDVANVEVVSGVLEEVTRNMNEVDDEGMHSIAETLEHIIATGASTAEITTSVGKAVNNLISPLEASESHTPELAAYSSSVVRSLEQQISLTLRETGRFTLEESNMAVMAVTYDPAAMPDGIEFSGVDGQWGQNTSWASIKLPSSIFGSNNTWSSKKQVRFIKYNSDTLFRSANATSRTSRNVISAAVEGAHINGLVEPVLISYQVAGENETVAANQSKCVYWDFKLRNGIGDWSDRGCTLHDVTDGVVTCACNHLTNFAVLIDYTGQHEDEQTAYHLALDLVSKIGCAISIVALLITIIVFVAFKRLRSSRPRRILVHFCISLMCLYIVFLFGIENAVDITKACLTVGVLIHYFLLTSMTWMAVEALNMYLMIVHVFEEEGPYFLKKACVFAWGTPIIVVGVTAGLRTEDYLNKPYCFLTPGPSFFLAVLLPIALVLAFNFITFIVVIRRLWTANLGGNVPIEKEDKAARYQQLRTRLLNAFSISVLLGLTWCFGFLAIEGATFIFQLLFCVANAFQGLVVFVMFCARQEDVRKSLQPHYARFTTMLPHPGGRGGPTTVTAYSLTASRTATNNTANTGHESRDDEEEHEEEHEYQNEQYRVVNRSPVRTGAPMPMMVAAATSRSGMISPSSDVVMLTSDSEDDNDYRLMTHHCDDSEFRFQMTPASSYH